MRIFKPRNLQDSHNARTLALLLAFVSLLFYIVSYSRQPKMNINDTFFGNLN